MIPYMTLFVVCGFANRTTMRFEPLFGLTDRLTIGPDYLEEGQYLYRNLSIGSHPTI